MPATLEAPPAATTPPPAVAAPTPAPAPRPGMLRPTPARDRVNQELEKLAKPAVETSTTTALQVTETKSPPDATKGASRETNEAVDATKGRENETKVDAAATTQLATDDKGKPKVSPWKLVDEWKGKAAALEKQLVEAKSQSLAEQEKTEYLKRIEKAEKRLKEYDDEFRFTNYAKSQEFVDKYQKPYEAEWNRVMTEIGELTIPTPDGQQRAVKPQDLLDLMNLPLGKAREIADQLYGPFANDVMGHRKELRRMADEQNQALEDAKTNGAARDKERQEKFSQTRKQVDAQITTTFKEAYDGAKADPRNGRFFTEKEGDDEWNAALEAGKKLSASAFTENPNDHNLTPEQRTAIVKRHAAIFNRSAAFGPMKRLVLKLEKELDALKKENEGFKGSRPGAADGTQQVAAGTTPVRRYDRVMADLAKLGK